MNNGAPFTGLGAALFAEAAPFATAESGLFVVVFDVVPSR